jgi:hypothetical protein
MQGPSPAVASLALARGSRSTILITLHYNTTAPLSMCDCQMAESPRDRRGKHQCSIIVTRSHSQSILCASMVSIYCHGYNTNQKVARVHVFVSRNGCQTGVFQMGTAPSPPTPSSMSCLSRANQAQQAICTHCCESKQGITCQERFRFEKWLVDSWYATLDALQHTMHTFFAAHNKRKRNEMNEMI